MTTYRITKPDGSVMIAQMEPQQAYEYLRNGCKVDISYGGFWFPITLGSAAF